MKDENYFGISKDEAVIKLNENGYKAVFDKGVVRITIPPVKDFKEVRDFLKEIDYRMSYGIYKEKGVMEAAL